MDENVCPLARNDLHAFSREILDKTMLGLYGARPGNRNVGSLWLMRGVLFHPLKPEVKVKGSVLDIDT